MNKKEVPIWEKSNLTLEEAALYSGIGINKLRKITEQNNCDFVLWNGSKRLKEKNEINILLNHFLFKSFEN